LSAETKRSAAVIVDGGARWLLSALFVALGTWYLADAAWALSRSRAGRSGRAATAVLHVLMSAAIISMLWAWGAAIPVIAQVTVFTAAAAWFAGHALFGPAGQPGVGCYGNWYHAGMMAVMVWMAVAMPLMSAPSSDGAVGGMSGMAMGGSGMDMGAAPAGATAATLMSSGSSGWAGAVSLALAAALFAAAAWQAFASVTQLAVADGAPAAGPLRGGVGGAAANGAGALLAAGMAVALLQMA
jgi:Domain of unknown function (DUF5134)